MNIREAERILTLDLWEQYSRQEYRAMQRSHEDGDCPHDCPLCALPDRAKEMAAREDLDEE